MGKFDSLSVGQVTVLLNKWNAGDEDALTELVPHIMPTLQRIARYRFSAKRPNQTMETVDRLSELYLRLHREDTNWESRQHFYNVASTVMKRILIDNARQYRAQKRSGDKQVGQETGCLKELVDLKSDKLETIMALNQALDNLRKLDKKQALILEWNYFLGLSHQQIARILRCSDRDVRRNLRYARSFVEVQLGR